MEVVDCLVLEDQEVFFEDYLDSIPLVVQVASIFVDRVLIVDMKVEAVAANQQFLERNFLEKLQSFLQFHLPTIRYRFSSKL